MSKEPTQATPSFGDIDLELRIPREHPLRALRAATDSALSRVSFISSQELDLRLPFKATLRAMLLQAVYGLPSDQLFLEQLDFNLLYRWFVGMSIDDPVWRKADYVSSRARFIRNGVGRIFFIVLEKSGVLQNFPRYGFASNLDDPLALFLDSPGIETADMTRLPETAKQALAQYGYDLLDAHFGLGKRPERLDIEIGNYDYERLCVTFHHNARVRASYCASSPKDASDRTVRDLEIAVDDCINDRRFGGPATADEALNTTLVLSFLRNRTRLPAHDLKTVQKYVDLGIHAVRVRQGEKSAFFRETVATLENLSHKAMIERLCRKAGLPSDAYRDPSAEILRYDSEMFRADRGGKITDLYRSDELISEDSITLQSIEHRLELAAHWFLNNVNAESGMGEYEYRPSADRYSPKTNHVRMLATAWSMAELQEFHGDQSLAGPIRRCAERYLADRLERQGITYIGVGENSPIALNAFMILLLLNAQNEEEDLPLLTNLADALVTQQQDDGALRSFFFSDRATGIDYYPGEAMLALMLLHAKTGNPIYQSAVARAFPYYRAYWQSNKNNALVPWHSQALRELYRVNKDPEIASFVFEMNDWLIDNSQIFSSPCPDEIGGFPRGLPGNSTGVYLEGINDAYQIAVESHSEAHVAKYRDSIRKGVRFLFQLQITEQNTFHLKAPRRATGGWRKSLVRNEQRNDYTQHAVRALIKAHENNVFPET